MNATISLLGVSLALSATGLTQVSLDPSWGSLSSASLADRRFSSTSTNFNFAPSVGGAGSLTSSNFLTESRGTASSFGSLDASDGLSVPVIRTFATTGPSNSAARGSSVVIEGYTYDGVGTASFNLDANLTGSFSNMDNDFAGNFATLSIWSPGDGFFPPIVGRAAAPDDDFFFSTDEGSYLEFGFNRLDTLRLEQNGIGTDDVLSGTLSWNMEPGDTVYLWVSGRSQVYGPNSTADARNTLTTSFQNAAGLTSLSGGIPEPSTTLLGLLGVFALARRKR
ncbi:MAG: hypothetical protein ACSHYB_19545 [Roseibacillus sp.]